MDVEKVAVPLLEAMEAVIKAAENYVDEYTPLLEAIRVDKEIADGSGNRQRVALLDTVEKYRRIRDRMGRPTARVTLYRRSGKYYTEEEWRIPEKAIGPYEMQRSPDFRRIDGGPVVVESQEPWGYPHIFPAEQLDERDEAWLRDGTPLEPGWVACPKCKRPLRADYDPATTSHVCY